MKSVQLDGILVTETDIGREIVSSCMEARHKYTIHHLGEDIVYCDYGYILDKDAGSFEWESPSIPIQATTLDTKSICPRQQAANALREAYAECEELGMDVCSYKGGSLHITYQPEEVVY